MYELMRRTLALVLLPSMVTSTLLAQRLSLRLETPTDGPAILAVGDTLRLIVHRERCDADVCERLPGAPAVTSYRSADARIVAVSRTGILIGHAHGRTLVEAFTREGVARTNVRVVPATKRIEWSTRVKNARVGDTLRVFLLARDSGGRVVAKFPPEAHIGETGRVVNWDAHGSTIVALDRPGLLILAARLGGRTDTLKINVR